MLSDLRGIQLQKKLFGGGVGVFAGGGGEDVG